MNDVELAVVLTWPLFGLLSVLLSARWHKEDRMPAYLGVLGPVALLVVCGVQLALTGGASGWLDEYGRRNG